MTLMNNNQIDFDDEDCRRERRGKYLKNIRRDGQSSKGRHKRNKPARRNKHEIPSYF